MVATMPACVMHARLQTPSPELPPLPTRVMHARLQTPSPELPPLPARVMHARLQTPSPELPPLPAWSPLRVSSKRILSPPVAQWRHLIRTCLRAQFIGMERETVMLRRFT